MIKTYKVVYQISEGVSMNVSVGDLDVATKGWKRIKDDEFTTMWTHEDWGTIVAIK